jgi:hypothetical protein
MQTFADITYGEFPEAHLVGWMSLPRSELGHLLSGSAFVA